MTGVFDWIMNATSNDWKKTAHWLELQKEGIFWGALAACAVYFFNISIVPIDETGFVKLAILIFIFSTGGALIDSVYKPRK
jgi:hypothetical protein